MDKDRVAAILEEIGTLLEIQGENPFRCQAYHNAARAVQQLEGDLGKMVADGKLSEVRGIGETLQQKVASLVSTGHLKFYEDLRAKTPPGLFQFLRLPGMGPKKVKALYEQLGLDTLEKLKEACEDGRVAALRGFGEKTQRKLLEGIAFLDEGMDRVRFDLAEALAGELVQSLKECPGIVRLEVCGSLRRRKETVRDIDILVSSNHPGPIMERFVSLPSVVKVAGHGETKSSIVVDAGHRGRRQLLNADLRVVRDEQFPFALHYFTGSKEHNVAMRARAQQYGLKLNEYELAGPERRIAAREEEDIFRALDLDYIPPELREHTGEMEAAADHSLPDLIGYDDLHGIFHCHSTWSDGRATIEEMARAAKRLGFKYLGIADHSQSLTVAGGLSPDRVRKQQAEIDEVAERVTGIRLLKGTECDILADGGLDYDDEVLAGFDYVVASVHSHFGQPMEEMTRRVVRALSHPRVTMLGHATGRLLLRREGYKLDIEAVLQAAAAHKKLIEINAQPDRLDVDWISCKRARALGVQLVINPDAHSTGELENVRYGVNVARRGWLEKKDVFNTQAAAQVTSALAQMRQPSS